MQLILYNIGISFYYLGIRIASLFNEKAKKWIAGRANWRHDLKNDFNRIERNNCKVIWMHCASLGEFEQGRTIIESLKQDSQKNRTLLTFYSPSGYEIRQDYLHADWVHYLPLDTAKNATDFLDIVKPDLAIFVKYEFWFHFLSTLKKRNIPTFLVAALFRDAQLFFKSYGRLHRDMLSCFTALFVQDLTSKILLEKTGINNAIIAGDPRIDRVLSIVNEEINLPRISEFCNSSQILICGSTWEKDERLIASLLAHPVFKKWKIILAPHDVSTDRLKSVRSIFKDEALLYSKLSMEDFANKRVLIIDSIGLLSKIYSFGNLAYIGGGFGSGIHNTLEPMAFGLPVIYGPNWKKFHEAKVMIENGGHFSIQSEKDLKKVFENLQDPGTLSEAKSIVKSFMQANRGATDEILERIRQYI